MDEDPFSIPQFLRVTPEIALARKASWRLHPPKPMPKFAQQPKRSEEPATRALRLEVQRAERAKDKMKLKQQAATAKDRAALLKQRRTRKRTHKAR